MILLPLLLAAATPAGRGSLGVWEGWGAFRAARRWSRRYPFRRGGRCGNPSLALRPGPRAADAARCSCGSAPIATSPRR